MSEPTDTDKPAELRLVSCNEPAATAPTVDQPDPKSIPLPPSESASFDSIKEEELDRIDETDRTSGEVAGKRVALVGRFGSMNRREAANVLSSFRAQTVDLPRQLPPSGEFSDSRKSVPDWIVIGAEQPPLSQTELLGQEIVDAAARGELEVIHETELWQRLGLVDVEQSVRSYHTPAMLADLLGVSVRIIRRWHRLGLITPVVSLHKLPYFDYAEVATAKRLAGWIKAGASPKAIERRLVNLIQVLPSIRRPLDQLSILVEGKHVLLRQGDGLIEPGGQMRFDFEALEEDFPFDEHETQSDDSSQQSIVAFERPDEPPMLRAGKHVEEDLILEAAYEAEDEGDLETAVELYHIILARDGARADISFQIGELLYRMNQLIAARERYYVAIELDPEFVEARASLGAVLAETGQNELAIAALRGALSMYEDYADVHYTLAKTLDKIGDDSESLIHWQRVLQLAPESPWADEARDRLGC